MKTEKELKAWFWDKFNNCYPVKHEEIEKEIFLYYDEMFIRQKKLSRITGKEIIYPEKPVGVCLFDLDWKNKYLWVDYNSIWSIFEKELGYNYQEIIDVIKEWLGEREKLSVLTPSIFKSKTLS